MDNTGTCVCVCLCVCAAPRCAPETCMLYTTHTRGVLTTVFFQHYFWFGTLWREVYCMHVCTTARRACFVVVVRSARDVCCAFFRRWIESSQIKSFWVRVWFHSIPPQEIILVATVGGHCRGRGRGAGGYGRIRPLV